MNICIVLQNQKRLAPRFEKICNRILSAQLSRYADNCPDRIQLQAFSNWGGQYSYIHVNRP